MSLRFYKLRNMASETRLNKYLSEHGVCSRRAADEAIKGGRVKIDGQVASLGQMVLEGQEVTFDGKVVKDVPKEVLIAFNKPVGITCTAAKDDKDNIIDFINYPERIYPIGRLDKDSHGLILLTNQGDLVNKIMKGSNFHEKEYVVRVDKNITSDFIKKMSEGVWLEELEVKTRKCVVKKLSSNSFKIILTQGLNRQIRRMCEALGYKVKDLKRVRIMNIDLGDLKEGTYRDLTQKEIKDLLMGLESSHN